MSPLRRRGLERALWLTLGHWYAFYLAVGYECLQQSGPAWIGALPWASFGTELLLAFAGEPLDPGAVLLAFFTVLMLATLVMLVHALRAVIAAEPADVLPASAAVAVAPVPVARPATEPASPAAHTPPAGDAAHDDADAQSQRMQMLVERFRERVARL